MLSSTLLAIPFVPVFYVLTKKLSAKTRSLRGMPNETAMKGDRKP
jgi:hypothetical protein